MVIKISVKFWKKEGEGFLFYCWDSHSNSIRLQVANHPNFIPTIDQMEIRLQDENEKIKQIYQLRQSEWCAKIEEIQLTKIDLELKKPLTS